MECFHNPLDLSHASIWWKSPAEAFENAIVILSLRFTLISVVDGFIFTVSFSKMINFEAFQLAANTHLSSR